MRTLEQEAYEILYVMVFHEEAKKYKFSEIYSGEKTAHLLFKKNNVNRHRMFVQAVVAVVNQHGSLARQLIFVLVFLFFFFE